MLVVAEYNSSLFQVHPTWTDQIHRRVGLEALPEAGQAHVHRSLRAVGGPGVGNLRHDQHHHHHHHHH